MGERSQERKEQYKRVRTDFEDLTIEDKALFLLEATVSTVARGIEQIGREFAEEVDKVCRRSWEREAEEESSESTNGSAKGGSGTAGETPASGAPS